LLYRQKLRKDAALNGESSRIGRCFRVKRAVRTMDSLGRLAFKRRSDGCGMYL